MWCQEEYKFGDVTKAAVNKAMATRRKSLCSMLESENCEIEAIRSETSFLA